MKTSLLLIIFSAIVFISCSSLETSQNDAIVDEYTTIFPNKEVAIELEEISNSLKLINNLTFYKAYIYSDSTITDENLDDFDLHQKAISVNTISKTSSGTGAIISVSGNNVALLTVAHIISYPDTIISYFTITGKQSKYIESILYKERQKIYSDLPEGGMLKIIAIDDKNDIAIVGNKFNDVRPNRFPIFNFNFGNAKELKWGSFVYILGFPMHNKMVTSGIVSNPNYDNTGNFLVDALINRGSSGGLVLAIRGAAPNFELVGIVSSVPAEKRFVLTPNNPTRDINFLPGTQYIGEMTVEQLDGIKYGIGRIVSSEKVLEFIKKNESSLYKQGYILNLD
ncbi:MAG: serine protease [Bacteroidetes bacterium]|nr:serine protease [Bacteroidota bacterium]MBU1115662.1 serine protease [Bacteroidota bacterium]MBU1799025.1 serine protease [Bacteroidota bacterium]